MSVRETRLEVDGLPTHPPCGVSLFLWRQVDWFGLFFFFFQDRNGVICLLVGTIFVFVLFISSIDLRGNNQKKNTNKQVRTWLLPKYISLERAFKQLFLIFKQYYIYFYIFFYLYIFLKNTNNVIKIILSNKS